MKAALCRAVAPPARVLAFTSAPAPSECQIHCSNLTDMQDDGSCSTLANVPCISWMHVARLTTLQQEPDGIDMTFPGRINEWRVAAITCMK